MGVVSPQESACADSLRHGSMDGTARRLGAAMGGPGVEEGTATTICADELAKVRHLGWGCATAWMVAGKSLGSERRLGWDGEGRAGP